MAPDAWPVRGVFGTHGVALLQTGTYDLYLVPFIAFGVPYDQLAKDMLTNKACIQCPSEVRGRSNGAYPSCRRFEW